MLPVRLAPPGNISESRLDGVVIYETDKHLEEAHTLAGSAETVATVVADKTEHHQEHEHNRYEESRYILGDREVERTVFAVILTVVIDVTVNYLRTEILGTGLADLRQLGVKVFLVSLRKRENLNDLVLMCADMGDEEAVGLSVAVYGLHHRFESLVTVMLWSSARTMKGRGILLVCEKGTSHP